MLSKLKNKIIYLSGFLLMPSLLPAITIVKSTADINPLKKEVVDDFASNLALITLMFLTLGGIIAVAIGIKKLAFEEKGQSQENNHVRGISFIAGGALWIVLMVFIGWVTGVNITIDE